MRGTEASDRRNYMFKDLRAEAKGKRSEGAEFSAAEADV